MGDISLNTVSKEQLNTAQSFGDFVYDAKAIEEQKRAVMEQSWNPMNGTFNVVEGSQLQRAMAMQNGNADEALNQEGQGYAPFTTGAKLYNPSGSLPLTQQTPDASATILENPDGDLKDQEAKLSQHSFGMSSFTTNTFNARLKDGTGMSILQYIQSENFGQFGESMKLVGSIHVSIPQLPNLIIRFHRNSSKN
jgi:hypothetical protein